MPLEGLRDFSRDEKAGATVGQRNHLAAVDFPENVGRAVVVGEGYDGIGMRVDDGGGGQEAVEQGFDGGARARRLLQGMSQIVHHLLVAHVLPLEQRQDIVHAHAGEMLALDALEVGAGALHPQHPHLPTAVVALDLLDGGVAAAPDDERGLRADEARGINEEVEAVEFFRRRSVPARVHGDTIPESVGSGLTL